MKYMLLMSGTKANFQTFSTLSPEDIKVHIEFMRQVNTDLADSGELVEAQGLAAPEQAKIVVVQNDGAAPAVTDGPFPESKEFLAGYWIVDCESPERVLEIASHIATAPGRGGVPIRVPIEVRQVMSVPGQEM